MAWSKKKKDFSLILGWVDTQCIIYFFFFSFFASKHKSAPYFYYKKNQKERKGKSTGYFANRKSTTKKWKLFHCLISKNRIEEDEGWRRGATPTTPLNDTPPPSDVASFRLQFNNQLIIATKINEKQAINWPKCY